MKIDGYHIIEKIGEGGMATVYRATQINLDRPVALKVMHDSGSQDGFPSERFTREAKIIAKLSHPHIIPIHDVGISHHKHYIAMEYQPSGDLKAKIKTGLSTSESVNIIIQIALALDFAHQKNYIHRDVKPANILFNAHGKALLTDFGVARVTSQPNTTTSGLLMGTPMYMSPEQVQGKKADHRTDIYSLGVIFYEMLMGKTPFEGDSAVVIAIKHLMENAPPLEHSVREFQPIVDKMLAKEPVKRWSTGADVISAITNLQRGKNKENASNTASHTSHAINNAVDQDVKRPWPINSVKTTVLGSTLLVGATTFFWLSDPQFFFESTKPFKVFESKNETSPFITPGDNTLSPLLVTNDSLRIQERNNQFTVQQPLNDKVGDKTTPVDQRIPSQQILSILKSAKTALAKGKLALAEKDFRAVLTIDKKNTMATQGMASLGNIYLKKAEMAIKEQDFKISSNYLGHASRVSPKHPKMTLLQKHIFESKNTITNRMNQKHINQRMPQKITTHTISEKQKAQNKIINDLLLESRQLLSQAALAPLPYSYLNNALQHFNTANTIDKDNSSIPKFKNQLIESHLHASKRALNVQAFKRAKKIVDSALHFAPDDSRLTQLKNEVESSLQSLRLVNNTLAFIDSNLENNVVSLKQLNDIVLRYSDTLQIAPTHKGLANKKNWIMNHYIGASKQALSDKNFVLVLQITSSGLKFEPKNSKLSELRQRATKLRQIEELRKQSTPAISIGTF